MVFLYPGPRQLIPPPPHKFSPFQPGIFPFFPSWLVLPNVPPAVFLPAILTGSMRASCAVRSSCGGLFQFLVLFLTPSNSPPPSFFFPILATILMESGLRYTDNELCYAIVGVSVQLPPRSLRPLVALSPPKMPCRALCGTSCMA